MPPHRIHNVLTRSAMAMLGHAIASAQPAPAPARAPEPAVMLNPFEIVETPDSYEATNTIGVTGTNRELRTLPLSMDAYTRTLLDEVVALDLTDVMFMSPNIDFRLDSGPGAGMNSVDQFRIRGLFSKEERRRNGFLTLVKTDLFSTDRVEILRGAQSLLYGQGISAGTVNTVTKRAGPGRFLESRLVLDDNGTARVTLDANASFGPLSTRVAAVTGKQHFWQDGLWDKPNGLYVDAAYRLSDRFTFRANHEYMHEQNRTRTDGGFIFRDNTRRDTRDGQRVDLLLLNGNAGGITINNEPLSWENYRSLYGAARGRFSFSNTTTASLEGRLTDKLSVRAAYNIQDTQVHFANTASNDLIAPTDTRAVDGQWTVRIDPSRNNNNWRVWATQLATVYEFDVRQIVKNQLVTGGEYRFKRQTFAQQSQYQVDANGEFIVDPAWTPSMTTRINHIQRPAYFFPVERGYDNSDTTAPGWAWRNRMKEGLLAPTPSNPRGFAGPSALTIREEDQLAGYANLLSTWFGGRIETMAGVRWDSLVIDNIPTRERLTDTTVPTWIVGGVYNFSESWGVYANTAKSVAGQGSFNPTPAGDFLPPGIGRAREAGIKLDLFGRRVSGSLTYYENSAGSESVTIVGANRNVVDADGINGRNGGDAMAINVETHGFEAALTFRPTRNWRMQLNAGTNEGRIIGDIVLPIYYNDQFHTDGNTVRIGSNSGPVLMVPSTPANPNSAPVPLTVAMLRDPSSPYFARLDPLSGRITNASTIGLTTPGVRTDATGLPITSHQLGFVSPTDGVYTVFGGGDYTTPNPQATASFNTNYAFTEGALKGLSVGGSAQWRHKIRQAYATIGGVRQLYYYPDTSRIDLRIAYERRFKRVRWTTQLNVQNVLGDQEKNYELTAAGVLNDIEIRDIPRIFVWSNTLRF